MTSRPHIPNARIDPATLPPLLMTSDPGSFAQNTLKVRDPLILEELIAQPEFSSDIKRGLALFREEILSGVIQPLRERTPDADFWNTVSCYWFGRSWLAVPWYWAETFFYRRILEITGYFQPGEWHARDPFARHKDAELEPDRAPARLEALVRDLPTDRAARFEMLMHAAVWGNRVDLSYNVEAAHGRAARLEDERANLLVDDGTRVWEFLSARPLRRIILVCDNAGTEFVMDLALVDFLLEEGITDQVILHVKPQPFYVSDAMPQDVEKTFTALLDANPTSRALVERLRRRRASGQLPVSTHWFYPTPLFYFRAPDDLWQEFEAADFLILKGDVNYRRAVGDAHWRTTLSFEHLTRYFSRPFVCLRTLKSELIVGLKPGVAEQLDVLDPDWRVNGKRGVIQANFGRT